MLNDGFLRLQYDRKRNIKGEMQKMLAEPLIINFNYLGREEGEDNG